MDSKAPQQIGLTLIAFKNLVAPNALSSLLTKLKKIGSQFNSQRMFSYN